MPARTDEGLRRLEEVARLLQELDEMGENIRLLGHTIVARSGRVGFGTVARKWVAHAYPGRPKRGPSWE